MKKLLFLTVVNFLFISYLSALNSTPPIDSGLDVQKDFLISNVVTIELLAADDLSNLNLVGNQQLTFKDENGNTVVVDMTTSNNVVTGAVLVADFSTSTSLSEMDLLGTQQLNLVDVVSGISVVVDFVIVDTVFH